MISQTIREIENEIEKALWELEVKEKLEEALKIYIVAEAKLNALFIPEKTPEYASQQRVLSYCLMRQGNILRQMDKPKDALALSEREISAARASGDEITLARALMSNGTNRLVAGEKAQGLAMLEESRKLYEQGEDFDHRQGLGWYWILQADLVNAGLVAKSPQEVITIATRALELLEPIQNWPGVARAYAARAKAYEELAEAAKAAQDRSRQSSAELKIAPGENID